jgi:hypothetical protein
LTNILITLGKIERDSKKLKSIILQKCPEWAHSAAIRVTHILGMHLTKFYLTRRQKEL